MFESPALSRIAVPACIAVIVALSSSPALAVGIVEFGTLPNGRPAFVEAISGNGQYTVGWGNPYPNLLRPAALRRAPDGSLENLGTLPGAPGQRQLAFGVSADGNVVVGRADSQTGLEAFRWTAETGMLPLVSAEQNTITSVATDASADGSVILGNWTHADTVGSPFIWTESTGAQPLGGLLATFESANAAAISNDGLTVVGAAPNPDGSGSTAYRWTEASGPQILEGLRPDLPSYALGTSGDGSVAVGHAYIDVPTTPSGRRPVMWDATGRITELRRLTVNTYAIGASYDGSIVVGNSAVGPMFWTAPDEPQFLHDFLMSRGVDLGGLELTEATGISDDGQKIVGYGQRGGVTVGFIATIPEPSTALLVGLGLGMCARRTRRGGRSASSR